MIHTKKYLISGGAIGSDKAWGDEASKYGINVVHFYHGNKTPHGTHSITPEDYEEGQQKVTIAARLMGRIEHNHQVRQSLLIRNWAQVKYSSEVYAVGTILKPGDTMNYGKKALIYQVAGGTGYAVQMAIAENKPVYIYDQVRGLWISIKNDEWKRMLKPPIITVDRFAGIGTREINVAGEATIREVMANSFSPQLP
jgi:hypothetical protein